MLRPIILYLDSLNSLRNSDAAGKTGQELMRFGDLVLVFIIAHVSSASKVPSYYGFHPLSKVARDVL